MTLTEAQAIVNDLNAKLEAAHKIGGWAGRHEVAKVHALFASAAKTFSDSDKNKIRHATMLTK